MSTSNAKTDGTVAQATEQEEPITSGNVKKNTKKRQGKNSKAKADEKFRGRKGEQVVADFRKNIERKFEMFSNDSDKQLESVVNNVQTTPRQRAIPLSVSTRGVGFATAVAYERTCTTWNMEAISEIATVHQVYRVHLWLAHYKVYLAQQVQSEMVTTLSAFDRITIHDEIREKLRTVTRVPSALALIYDSIGKFSSNDKVYHMGYTHTDIRQDPSCGGVIITPDNIRHILEFLTQPAFPEERADFVDHNSIPGMRIEANILQNIDEIWPEAAIDSLSNDIHAYKNWITRVENRLPKHSFSDVTWTGLGNESGLWSTERLDIKLTSRFMIAAARVQRRRNAAGVVQDCRAEASNMYRGFALTTVRSEFWSRETTSHLGTILGVTSLVGEVCGISTRHEINCGESVTLSPIDLLYSIADASR